MDIKLDRAALGLQARELCTHDAAGIRVQCLHGSVWITQDRDQEDYHLGAGQALVLIVRDLP